MALEDSDPKIPPRPLPELSTSGPGNTYDIGKDDLVPKQKRRLGDYVALTTRKNQSSIKDGSSTFALQSPSGNPAALSDPKTFANNTYTETLDGVAEDAKALLNNSSNSGMLDTDTPFTIKKGKSDSVAKTGLQYFREVDALGGKAEIPQRVEQALLANNRFNENYQAVQSGDTEKNSKTKIGGLIIQTKYGTHIPKKFSNNGTAESPDIIDIEKLKNFGLITLLNASGEVAVNKDLDDPTKNGRDLSTLAPGLARIGQRVPVTRFDGVKILNEAYPTFQKPLRDLTISDGKAVPSYGNVNNPLAPFDAFGTGASQASAIIMSLTVSNLIKSLAVTINAVRKKRQLDYSPTLQDNVNAFLDPVERRELRIGSNKGRASNNSSFNKFKDYYDIDLVSTTYPYFDALERGIDVFFNFSNTGAESGAVKIINESYSAVKSTGYYNTMLRELLRSSTDLFMQQLNPVDLKLNTKMDIDKTPGDANIGLRITANTVSFINQLNNSKLLKFMNILAYIGDSVLKGEANGQGEEIVDININNISDESNNSDFQSHRGIHSLHMKSRLSNGKLAWGASTLPSAYLLPQSLMRASDDFDGGSNRFIPIINTNNVHLSNTNRIDTDTVKKYENYLEADYLPFYFHDIRTNEIIAFHAFLESLNDSFTVSYNESEGYGRVGKVMTYKNTNRSIGLTFMVVATNDEDFSEMWIKINKLTTMLYPQWSEGRVLEYNDAKFVQPFSQVPAASPLIRLRIGDIIKSNYNKFSLARLFGVGTSNFNMSGSTTMTDQRTQAINRKKQSIIESYDASNPNRFTVNQTVIIAQNNEESSNSTLHKYMKTADTTGAEIILSFIPGVNRNVSSAQNYVIIRNSNTKVKIMGHASETSNNGKYVVKLINPGSSVYNGTFYARPEDLSLDMDWVTSEAEAYANSIFPPRPNNTISTNDFFNSDNPIVKSFESTRGKGLAGFITNFSMNIEQNTIWETDYMTKKAPKFVKIEISFEPIHDINPGIDSNGFNSAPIYGIGGMAWVSSDSPSELARDMDEYDLNTQIKWRRGNSQ